MSNEDFTLVEERPDGFSEFFDRSAMTHCFVDRHGRRWSWRLNVPEHLVPNYRLACLMQAKAARSMPKGTKTYAMDGERLRLVGRCGHMETVRVDDVAGFVTAVQAIYRDNDIKEGLDR